MEYIGDGILRDYGLYEVGTFPAAVGAAPPCPAAASYCHACPCRRGCSPTPKNAARQARNV